MDLENIQVALRPRPSYQALDLGVMLARRYWINLFAGWLLVATPIYILCWFQNLFFALLILWWCKPMYERYTLTILASAIFGETTRRPSILEIFRQRGFWLWMTFFRLFPGRSTLMPIDTLEDLTQSDIRPTTRRKLIKQRSSGSYIWLHYLCFLLEFALVASAIVLILWLISPMGSNSISLIMNFFQDILNWYNNSPWASKIILTLFFTAFALIGPFYVACGFALYLNGRIEIEGWDIDLGFQKIARRVGSALVVFCVVLFAVPGRTEVVQIEVESLEDKAKEEITEIVEGGLIFEPRTIMVPDFIRDFINRLEPDEGPRTGSPLWGQILVISAWILLAAGIVWFLYKIRIWDYASRLVRKRSSQADTSDIYDEEGLDLPDDVLLAANRAWERGHIREAISLLYCGALDRLMSKHDCYISISDTESACMRTVASSAPQMSGSFNLIVRSRQNIAYANTSINNDDFLELSNNYERSFT